MPSKHGHEGLIVWCSLSDLMGLGPICGGQDVQFGFLGVRCRGTREVEHLRMIEMDHGASIDNVLGSVPVVKNIMVLDDDSLVVIPKLIKCRR